jgi:hypothetical protein
MHNYIWCPYYLPSFMKFCSGVSEELHWQTAMDRRTDRTKTICLPTKVGGDIIWDLLILYFFSIFFLPLIGLYILFTVHPLTLFRHRSAIVFPERNVLQRQSSVSCRCRWLNRGTLGFFVYRFCFASFFTFFVSQVWILLMARCTGYNIIW